VVGADDELRGLIGQVGGVALDPGQGTGCGFQVAVDALGRPGQFDEPVAKVGLVIDETRILE